MPDRDARETVQIRQVQLATESLGDSLHSPIVELAAYIDVLDTEAASRVDGSGHQRGPYTMAAPASFERKGKVKRRDGENLLAHT
jgi:hypothetical protein